MEMRLTGTSASVKFPMQSITDIGFSVANGAMIMFKQGPIAYKFLMSDPVLLSNDTKTGAAMLGTDWFRVKDIKKGVLFQDFHEKLADLEIKSSYGVYKIDVSLKIYDELNEPWYQMEKVNIKNRGFATYAFKLRAKLILKGQVYHGKIKDTRPVASR